MEAQNERVLARKLARELTPEEMSQVSGAGTYTACTCTNCGTDYCPDVNDGSGSAGG